MARIGYGAPVFSRWLRIIRITTGITIALLVHCSHAEDFYGFGPAPMRNYQPIQLIFLNLPVERARTLAAGTLEAHLETVESNTIATVSNPQVQGQLKLETNRTVIGAKFGVWPGLDVGVDIPFLSHFGGMLDSVIDPIEHALGTFNPERDLYPDNSFGAFLVRQGNTTVFQGKRQVFELGDIWFSAKQEVWSRAHWPLVSLRAAIKAPTGRASAVFGSGHPDFGLGFAAEQQPLPWLILYADLAGIFPVGPITPARLTLHPALNQAVAAEAQVLWPWFSLLLQQELYTSPLHGNGTRILDGTVVELTWGANARVGPTTFQLAMVDNISPVATAADFSVLLRVGYEL